MFSIDGKIIVCDLSKFTLGVDVAIIENQKVISKSVAEDQKQAIQLVYSLCNIHNINNVFIKPLAPTNKDKVMSEFKAFGQNEFSKNIDKIHFHMI